ncbi:MAG: tetratricopeptide repeat-containing glycosyltransferase family protein [Fibrobacterales bacterium]
MRGLGDLLTQALKLQQAGHTTAASVLYQEILYQDQNCADAHHLLGCISITQGDFDNALIHLKRAVEINPEQYLYQCNLGVCYVKLNIFDMAKAHFIESIEQKGDFKDSRLNCGHLYANINEWDYAEEQYRAAVDCAPSAETFGVLGEFYRTRRRYKDAIRSFSRGCDIDPTISDMYLKMGLAYTGIGEKLNAIWAYTVALQNDPMNVGAHNNLGTLHLVENKIDQAITFFSEAQRVAPGDSVSGWNLAKCYFLQGDLHKGWPLYHHRWEVFGKNYMQRNFHRPEWNNEPLNGKRIVLYNEQGIGDQIQNLRFVAHLQQLGAHVIVECHPSLYNLVHTNFLVQTVEHGTALPEYDYFCSFNSLPAKLNVSQSDVGCSAPYIVSESILSKEWYSRLALLGALPRIGIVWAGNSKHPNDRLRSTPYETFIDLFVGIECSIVNLQVGADTEVFDDTESYRFNAVPYLKDYNETVALIENLDLVIAVDTSVVHLCGAMHKPVWALLAYNPDWRWMLNCRDTYWYPSVELFRQESAGDWKGTISTVNNALSEYVKNFKNV